MKFQDVFNPRPPLRSADQWKDILRWAVRGLEDHLGVPGRITDSSTKDDKPGSTSYHNVVDVVFETHAQLGYDLCGVVGCRVNVGKGVSLDGDFLAFASGIRVPQHRHERLTYVFDPEAPDRNEWSCSGWKPDESGAWGSTKDNSRWRKR
jgi:hypothetical protein